jgi:hypothetical protein
VAAAVIILPVLLLTSSALRAADEHGWLPPDNNPWNVMDYGPFIMHTIGAPVPAGNVAVKGIAIKLGKPGGPRAAILFDTELCRVAAGWSGGFLHLTGVAFDTQHGVNPTIKGAQLFGTRVVPGWANPEARLDDPRPKITDQGANLPYGPLPREWAHYNGLYVSGDNVVLSYTIGGNVAVLETPGVETLGDATVITRTIKIANHERELLLRVAEVIGTDLSVKLAGVPANMDAVIEGRDGALFLRLPARKQPTLLKLLIGLNVKAEPAPAPLVDPETLTKGGPAHWTQPVETKGIVSTDDKSAYVTDTLTPPENNPYKSWIRFGGFDFLDKTSAALCTWSGDVWTCSGIDDKLEKLTWRRVATGLFQPLGLKVVDGTVYVLGRDGITRLHDLNGDGEADFYENFNNDVAVTPAFHEFAFDLQTDPAGNFYFAKAGGVRAGGQGFEPIGPHNGCLLRVTKDGAKLDVVATGFRAPNGIGVGPSGELTTGDNQGTWTPNCRLNWVKPGGFYGVVDLAHRDKPPTQTDNPLCWLPHDVDNSSGGQCWVTSDKWGPAFAGKLLHTSYGTTSLFAVMHEDVGGDVQGGVVRFPLKFDSGIMRPRFNPTDGQLYICGLKGWQSNAVKDACFHRVRYTGKPANMPCGLKVTGQAIEITFTDPLERLTASDAGSYSIEQWNYVWSGAYGSPDVSVLDPKQKKHDTLEVKSAKLSPDGKTITLDVPGLRPVMQMKIGINVDAADGNEMKWEIHNTINRVGNKGLVVKMDGVEVVDVPPAPPAPAPVTKPTTGPTTARTTVPSTAPTTRPSTAPSTRPSTAPSTLPTTTPSTKPTTVPTAQPRTAPTTAPSTRPTTAPSTQPTTAPAPPTQPTTAPAPPTK